MYNKKKKREPNNADHRILITRDHLLDRHPTERTRVVILALNQGLAAIANAVPARNDSSTRNKVSYLIMQ